MLRPELLPPLSPWHHKATILWHRHDESRIVLPDDRRTATPDISTFSICLPGYGDNFCVDDQQILAWKIILIWKSRVMLVMVQLAISKLPRSNLRDVAFQMHRKFDDYYRDWAKSNLMVLITIVFDPRYKLKFVRFSFRKLYPNDFAKADRVYDHLYNVLKRLHDSYSSCVNVDKNDHNGSSSPIHVDHSKTSLDNDTLKESKKLHKDDWSLGLSSYGPLLGWKQDYDLSSYF
ncbi:hypothetical protein Cgig2_023732 [Carnegiea gigantea]|uniref:hAT-like transposase RNase-H fold domain-containing protein n=1 Tax=Carnegiea gigantea TaxID=171969 RepID=A0A9Q1GV49_9CARY|nr:hypothetical protein Cgig2_023732 [Carnegiea gigantea]